MNRHELPDASLHFTRHAEQRLMQRGLSEAAVDACLCWGTGRSTPPTGQRITLRARDVSRARREGVDIGAYEGVTVVCTKLGTIITAYRR